MPQDSSKKSESIASINKTAQSALLQTPEQKALEKEEQVRVVYASMEQMHSYIKSFKT